MMTIAEVLVERRTREIGARHDVFDRHLSERTLPEKGLSRVEDLVFGGFRLAATAPCGARRRLLVGAFGFLDATELGIPRFVQLRERLRHRTAPFLSENARTGINACPGAF